MKELDIHIAHMLVANAKKDYSGTINAIKMFLDGRVVDTIKMRHWIPQKEKPTSSEYIEIDNEYWVQEDEFKLDYPHYSNVSKNGHYIENINCPVCNHKMIAYMVTTCPKANPRGWRGRLECSNQECLHEIYTKTDIYKIKKMGDL